ncbi:MAG: hypothetical protein GY765_38560 [bacterium]|nr:hypothetical protein [bacterium]
MIREALEQHGWNKLKAAESLNISRQHLNTLINRHGIVRQ